MTITNPRNTERILAKKVLTFYKGVDGIDF